MGFNDYDKLKIGQENYKKESIPIKRDAYIPAMHNEARDSIELHTNNKLKPAKKNFLDSAKYIIQTTFKPQIKKTEPEIPEKLRKYDETERRFYSECLKWEAAPEEKILELLDYISQMEPEDKQSVLEENFGFIKKAEDLLSGDEKIISAFNDGRITKGDIFGIAQLPDKQADCIKDLLSNKKFTSFLAMNKSLGTFGLESLADIEAYLEETPVAFGEDVRRAIEDGFDVFTALTLAFNEEFRTRTEGFIDEGFSDSTALTLANIENLENFDLEQVARLSENIMSEGEFELETAQYLSDFLNDEENANLDLNDFNSYIEDIDMPALQKLAPSVKNYDGKQMLEFSAYHYKAGTEEFTPEALTLSGDFTAYLMQNYINADELTELFAVFPMTSRNVGTMPESWLKNRPDTNNATEEIYSAITDFQKSGKKEELAKNLSEITGKATTVERLGSGHYGTGYKISMQGCDDMCLKTFKTGKTDRETNNIHGQHIEVQTGLFVNEHSNDFVKMYFGRVSPGNNDDGFIVTQFLSDETEPVETGTGDTEQYTITTGDTSGKHNIIHGKIIDYGAVSVDLKKAE